MKSVRYAVIAFALSIPMLAGAQQQGSETYYRTNSGVLTNMPSEDASRYGTYGVQVKSEKEQASEKLMNQVINEVQGIREGLSSYRGKSSEYLNKEYRFKPDIDISISSQIQGEEDKYTIYGKHTRLKGYYSIDQDGNVENTLE